MRFGELLLYNSTSDCLETAWVSSWVVDCQLNWNFSVETGSFLFRAIKITGMSGNVRFGELYYVIQHQIVLKLLECHLGVVDCQSELKLFCGNRDFIFKASKITDRRGNMRFWELLLLIQHQLSWNCLSVIWGSGLSIWIKIVCGNREFIFRAFQNQDRGRIWVLESLLLWINIRLSWNCLSVILG